MHFHRRQTHGLERVQYGHAGMRVRGRVNHDAVHFAIGLLDAIYDCTLVIGLEYFHLNVFTLADFPDEALKRGVIPISVDVRLAQAEQVQVRPVNHK